MQFHMLKFKQSLLGIHLHCSTGSVITFPGFIENNMEALQMLK